MHTPCGQGFLSVSSPAAGPASRTMPESKYWLSGHQIWVELSPVLTPLLFPLGSILSSPELKLRILLLPEALGKNPLSGFPSFYRLPAFPGPWPLSPSSKPAKTDHVSLKLLLSFSLCLCCFCYHISFSDSGISASLLGWLWAHPGNPGSPPHLKILNLIASAKSHFCHISWYMQRLWGLRWGLLFWGGVIILPTTKRCRCGYIHYFHQRYRAPTVCQAVLGAEDSRQQGRQPFWTSWNIRSTERDRKHSQGSRQNIWCLLPGWVCLREWYLGTWP